ncbi:MAG: DNA-3-methyladenine glycosylase family protein [Actinoallomurus sp.]
MTVVRIDAVGSFHHRAALALLAAHAIPGVEHTNIEGGTHTRLCRLAGTNVRVTLSMDRAGVTADIEANARLSREAAVMIRSWLDLDTDSRTIDEALRDDPVLRPMIKRRPGIRLIGYPDEFEAIAATVLGQQVSLAAARTFAGRLAEALGERAQGLIAFPAPGAIASVQTAELQQVIGLSRARAATLHAVATAWAAGISLRDRSLAEARSTLLAIAGVGPWTADYVSIRALQDPTWAPYRSYATLHLWTESAYLKSR